MDIFREETACRSWLKQLFECGAPEEPDVPDEAELFSNDYSTKLFFGPDPELNRW